MYAFRDAGLAAKEDNTYLIQARIKKNFDSKDYESRKASFGTIVIQSDQDLSLKTVFLSYSQRWKLELLFDGYKNDEMFDCTSVQSDYSVIGSEFINLISTTIISRILQRCEQLGLLDEYLCQFDGRPPDLLA